VTPAPTAVPIGSTAVRVTEARILEVPEPEAAAVGLALPKGKAKTSSAPIRGPELRYGPGSALALVQNSEATTKLLYVTDRGPNADPSSAQEKTHGKATKVFPKPGFAPRFGELTIDWKAGNVTTSPGQPLRWQGRELSGLPPGRFGGPKLGKAEVALDAAGKVLAGDGFGLDPEGLALGPGGILYITEEYAPSLLKVRSSDGEVLAWWVPGQGLPKVFGDRRPNRGFEGVTTTPKGDVVAFLQSPIASSAESSGYESWIRGVRLRGEQAVGELRFPVDERFKSPGDAKIGDLVALDESSFLFILQGDGDAYVMVAVVDGGCTSPEVTECGLLKTRQIARLSEHNWRHEKTEGLVVLGPDRVALINDNDFGLGGKEGVAALTQLLVLQFSVPFSRVVAELRP
jgi:hypothetical protein